MPAPLPASLPTPPVERVDGKPDIQTGQEPAHLVVQREIAGLRYEHEGIWLGDGTVVHFTGEPGTGKVGAAIRRTSYDNFAKTGVVYEDHWGPARRGRRPGGFVHPALMAICALAHCGEVGYDLFGNNCEHFASFCSRGLRTSGQVSRARFSLGLNVLAGLLLGAPRPLLDEIGLFSYGVPPPSRRLYYLGTLRHDGTRFLTNVYGAFSVFGPPWDFAQDAEIGTEQPGARRLATEQLPSLGAVEISDLLEAYISTGEAVYRVPSGHVHRPTLKTVAPSSAAESRGTGYGHL